MAYIDIITLEDAKNYLRIDDTLTEDDASIVRMINAAFRYIEKYTNVIVSARDIAYNIKDGYARIYDYPINTDLDALTDYIFDKNSLYYIVCDNTGATTELTLNVGFADVDNVPEDLIEVAYEMIDLYYGESKDSGAKKKLSSMSMDSLNLNKRFIV